MKNKPGVVLTLLLFCITLCHGSTAIQWGSASMGTYPLSDNYFLGITSPNEWVFGIEVIVTITPDKTKAVLQNSLKNYLTADSALLVQVGYNTPIDASLFLTSSGSFFNAYSSSGGHITEADLTIDFNDSIFLAFTMGGFNSVENTFYCYWYGWLELCYDKTGVHIVDKTVPMTTGSGIYAGTYNVVPEPSTALLALSGVALLFYNRRRTRKG